MTYFGRQTLMVLKALGARRCGLCALPDFAELLARVDVALVPIGQPVRPSVTGGRRRRPAYLPPLGAELVAAQFDTVAAAAGECDRRSRPA